MEVYEDGHEMRGFSDSGIVEDKSLEYCDELSMSELNTRLTQLMQDQVSCCDTDRYHRYSDLLHTKIPVAKWRLAELELFSTRIPIAKWRLREFYVSQYQ